MKGTITKLDGQKKSFTIAGGRMKIGETRREQARFAEQDAKALDDLAEELRSFHWEVDACGRDGQIHLDKARELARDAIKRLVNYI